MTQMILVPAHVLERAMQSERANHVIDDFMSSYRDPIGPHPFQPYLSKRSLDRLCAKSGCGASINSPVHN